MAYQILSFATSPFTQQRTYTILCDTAADLPASVDGYSVTQGFTAKIIEDGSTYVANTSGTWKKQPDGIQLDLTGYYTAAQTDSLLAGKQDSLTQSQLDAIDNAATVLPEIIDAGAKNIMQITVTPGTHSASGIDYTVNADQTEVTAENIATSTSYIILQTLAIKAGTYVISGCPAGGGDATYKIRLGDADNANAYITQDIGDTQEFTLARDYNMYVMIYIFPAAGNVNLTFRPMICTSADWAVSHEYSPYCPTLYDLYKLVKSYHP